MARKPIALEGAALAYFKANVPGSYKQPIMDGLAEKFGIRISKQTAARIAKDLGIKFRDSRTSGDAGRSTRKHLPQAVIDRALELIKTRPLNRVLKDVRSEFDVDISASLLSRRIVDAGGEIGNYNEKEEFVHSTRLPLGTERWEHGRMLIKVCHSHKSHEAWRCKHTVEWEKHNGRSVPDGYMVRMADPDRQDYSPENLFLVSLGQNAVINKSFNRKQLDATTTPIAIAIADITLASAQRAREAGNQSGNSQRGQA